jgi:hypothetical protein
MFRYSVFVEFLTWVAFYIIFKAVMHLVNIETRRNGSKTAAGVAGLLA